jgi:hypothetical protein
MSLQAYGPDYQKKQPIVYELDNLLDSIERSILYNAKLSNWARYELKRLGIVQSWGSLGWKQISTPKQAHSAVLARIGEILGTFDPAYTGGGRKGKRFV